MVTRLNTLMVERKSAEALLVAEEVARLIPDVADQINTPALHRFTLNHASLLFRRGGPGDAERARYMVLALADAPHVRVALSNPDPVVRSDGALARTLPGIQLALNRIGRHREAASLGERLMEIHRSPHTRYHAAALNTSLCWHAEGLTCWCAGDHDAATEALSKGIGLLERELGAGAPHLASTPAVRESALLLRESNLLYGQLWHLVASSANTWEALEGLRLGANSLLDRSIRNKAVNPVALILRHGRLADVLTEQAVLCEEVDTKRSAVLAMSALVYYAPRWEIYRRDNDMTPAFVIHYAEASRLAGDRSQARALLSRGIEHLSRRYGPDYGCVRLIRIRLANLDA
jgi:hypothetical protein